MTYSIGDNTIFYCFTHQWWKYVRCSTAPQRIKSSMIAFAGRPNERMRKDEFYPRVDFSSCSFADETVSWVGRSYYIRWRIKYWLLDQCYHPRPCLLQLIRTRAHTHTHIADGKTRGRVSFLIVIWLIQSWISKRGFFSFASITRKQEREQLALGILLRVFSSTASSFVWTCLEDKDNLSTRTIWSATIQHIVSLVMMIIANTQTDACSTPAEENDKHESHLLIWTTDTDKSGRKRLFICFSFDSKDED